MPPRILILSLPEDVHALSVAWILRQNGIACDIWYQSDYPAYARLSLRLAPGGSVSTSIDAKSEIPIRTVWSRRFGRLHLGDHVSPEDREIATRECGHFLNAMRYCVGADAFWINPYRVEFFATSKAVQLRLADHCGLRVPDTLMANDIDAIRAFLRQHGSVIYKPYFPPQWQDEQRCLYGFARVLSEALLDDPQAVQFCPGIYQPQIPKAYEARVTVMGREVLACRIDATTESGEIDDWRTAHIGNKPFRVAPIALPESVRNSCFALMRALGIVFGCFDFTVDHDGKWYFLEVNPMGQFLWVEHECPEIPMLEAFCNFLIAGRAEFARSDEAYLSGIRLAQVLEDPDFKDWKNREAAAHAPSQAPALGTP